jgi:hypothetical protein
MNSASSSPTGYAKGNRKITKVSPPRDFRRKPCLLSNSYMAVSVICVSPHLNLIAILLARYYYHIG